MVEFANGAGPGRAGTAQVTAVHKDFSLCASQVVLRDGQITLQTALTPASGSTIDVAVTGGTGRYTGALSSLQIKVQADGSQLWTLQLRDR